MYVAVNLLTYELLISDVYDIELASGFVSYTVM